MAGQQRFSSVISPSLFLSPSHLVHPAKIQQRFSFLISLSQLSTTNEQEQGSLSLPQLLRQPGNRDSALLSSPLSSSLSAEHDESQDSNNTKRDTVTKESTDELLCLKQSPSLKSEEKGGGPTAPVLGLRDDSQSQVSGSNAEGGTETEGRDCLKQSQERKENPTL